MIYNAPNRWKEIFDIIWTIFLLKLRTDCALGFKPFWEAPLFFLFVLFSVFYQALLNAPCACSELRLWKWAGTFGHLRKIKQRSWEPVRHPSCPNHHSERLDGAASRQTAPHSGEENQRHAAEWSGTDTDTQLTCCWKQGRLFYLLIFSFQNARKSSSSKLYEVCRAYFKLWVNLKIELKL